ncbi:MAG: bifunctional glutamate N-acetyltransferase/amino-acid acetyltransferase ArgJ [Acidobacteria bacterium]|nr:bifunctional glutamate N-acetyltransferase/amino-acid acetyltransferase ArgJ [Acidobacteriota bacterium]
MASSVRKDLPLGFRWAAVKAGIKASGRPDVAIAVADKPCPAAVMFTRNQVVAAPIIVGRENIAASTGLVKAIVVNAGNANCATGQTGIDAARATCTEAAKIFGCNANEVFPSSTGIIGVPLPVEKLIAALPSAADALENRPSYAEDFANAIMTTDTKLKVAQGAIEHDGKTVHLFGAAKGAGMIGPQLGPPHATMLVYLFTDLDISAADLRMVLEPAVDASFNSISVDGDTSTNDTLLLLASGASNVAWSTASADLRNAFTGELQNICNELAHAIIDDGEGVTHVVTLDITGARNDAEAKTIARSIAHSPLCKTAWSSADPNWGRLLAAAGYSGVEFDPTHVTVTIGNLPVFENGMRSPAFDEAATHAIMQQREYTIAMNMGQGQGKCRFLTCDLTVEYVHINADYST